MSAYTSVASRRAPQNTTGLRGTLGFAPAAIPVVIGLGLAFLMLTTPDLFKVFAGWNIGNGFTKGTFRLLDETASTWKTALRAHGLTTWVHLGLKAVLLAVPLLVAAAAVRSALVRTWQPLAITALALVLGIVSIPVVTWVCELGAFLLHVLGIVYDAIVWFFAWIAPVLGVIVVVVAGLAVLAGIVALVLYIHERKWWLGVAIGLALAGGLAYVISQGWLDGLFAWLVAVAHAIAVWIATYLGPIVGWLVQAVVFLLVLMVMLGAFCGGFGQVGRTLWLPLKSAGSAGRDQAKCADTAAGIGVSLSLLLTAAATNTGFGLEFTSAWRDAFAVVNLPSPVPVFGFLLRERAETILAQGFGDFNPVVDVLLLVLLFAIAILSLLLQRRAWTPGAGSKVAVPVMVGLGLALAIAIPLLLLNILANPD